MTPTEKQIASDLVPHMQRAQTLANAILKCADEQGWDAAEMVAAIPMAVAVVTPIERLDTVMGLMQKMCDGRKVGEAKAAYV